MRTSFSNPPLYSAKTGAVRDFSRPRTTGFPRPRQTRPGGAIGAAGKDRRGVLAPAAERIPLISKEKYLSCTRARSSQPITRSASQRAYRSQNVPSGEPGIVTALFHGRCGASTVRMISDLSAAGYPVPRPLAPGSPRAAWSIPTPDRRENDPRDHVPTPLTPGAWACRPVLIPLLRFHRRTRRVSCDAVVACGRWRREMTGPALGLPLADRLRPQHWPSIQRRDVGGALRPHRRQPQFGRCRRFNTFGSAEVVSARDSARRSGVERRLICGKATITPLACPQCGQAAPLRLDS